MFLLYTMTFDYDSILAYNVKILYHLYSINVFVCLLLSILIERITSLT